MQAYTVKELTKEEELDLVIEIVEKLRKKRISYGQAYEILEIAQIELRHLPLSEDLEAKKVKSNKNAPSGEDTPNRAE